jgi:hypothetical protein
MQESIIILSPVYNDWPCVQTFFSDDAFTQLNNYHVQFLLIDDGSVEKQAANITALLPTEVIELNSNLGHQKAIAIGLSYIYHTKKVSKVIVMDADGEDAPIHISNLLKEALLNPLSIITAKRIKRKESLAFRTGYAIYKLIFFVLTGNQIAFGNFVIIPSSYLKNLVYRSDIWNHLAAGIIKSRLPVKPVPIQRGRRYTDYSKMNFTRLLLHGLGAITVFVDFVTARILVLSLLFLALSVLSIAGIISVKMFTQLAIPGWASILSTIITILFIQSFLLTLFTLLLYLSSQSLRQFIPGIHYKDHISRTYNL